MISTSMTRKNKASRAKVLFTILQIFVFVGVMLYADVFWNSSEQPINTNAIFLGGDEDVVGINLDNANINISSDSDDNSIIYYIAQEWDTLESVSKEFWIPVAELKKINKLWNDLKVGEKLIVSDNEEGILYVVKTPRTLKLFAEYYRLNLEDLVTLNHFSDESEMLYAGQEIFINVTEQRAYDIWLLEKPQPILPKDEPIRKPSSSKTSSTNSTKAKTSVVGASGAGNITATSTASNNANRKQWYFNKKVSNGFAAGYCTWYAAYKSPWMFDENGQRLFGGNAKDWYVNAQSERAKAAGIKTSKTNPGPGAVVVYNPLRSYAGHVAVVIQYNKETGEMLIEDMNYVGKYIVTQRWDNVSNPKIIGYVYK